MVEEDEKELNDEADSEPLRKSRFRKRRKSVEAEDEMDVPKRRRGAKRRRERTLTKRDLEEEEKKASVGRLWLEQNWKTMLALLLIFLFGLFLRSYFYYPPATEDGFILSGNDPYYHKRVADYVQENHHHLIFDPLLCHPDGSYNPRPPMFDWSIAIVGLLLSPLFGGDVGTSTWQVMEFSPAFWGALTVIPVYFIGKEMFNKKAGLICAFLLATMPSHVERSPLGFSDHDAIALFFVVLSFFFFIKALNSLAIREKWVDNWLRPKEMVKGFRKWFKYNQVSVAFSLLSGLALASVALIWKGFLYAIVIIIVYFFIQLILNKLRNKDSLGVALCTILTLVVVALLPIPYYNGNNMPKVIRPASEILLAVIFISAILVPTKDSPWLLVFSILATMLITGFVLLIYVFPDIGNTYFSGQGYFINTKIFETIAEAQAPDYSRATFSYGVATSFLAYIALVVSIIRVAKDMKAHYLFMTIWGLTAVYMTISATRFIFNAGPIFAILSGWMVYEIIKKLDFRRMLKHYRSLKGGGRFYGMKKSVKVSHIAGVLFLVFLILIPNVWLGWDAGVPFGEKKAVDVAVYDALPWFMKPEEYDSEQAGNTTRYPDGTGTMYNKTNLNELKYFGAFGHGFPSDYWLDGMRWLSEQDQDLPIEERPGFISWWDYGFWAIYLGEHPTAADNFQGRVQYAGSFISAKNETQATSLLIARILEADRADYRYKDGHGVYKLHGGVRDILVKYFGEEKTTEIEDVLYNTAKYKSEVLDNPERYGHYASDLVADTTPIYAVLQTWIPELLDDDQRTWLLHDLQEETGYSQRYFAIDSRLVPFGPQNTGIYYAPLKLSDHRINDNNEPYDFLQTFIVGSDSREYTVEEFREAQEKDPKLEVREFKLRYYEQFLDSMLLKCYLGYTLEDIGAADPGEGGTEPNLPAIHATNYPPMQAWMMKHFQLVYRTAYWNPYNQSEYKYHPDAWVAMLDTDANALVEKLESDGIDNDNNGKMDKDDRGEGGVVTSGLKSGVVFIKYYEGAYLNGTVRTTKGTPVRNVRVTVSDEYGIPHDTTFTDDNGEYHLIAPSGNVTVDVTTGGFGEGDYVAYNVLTQNEIVRLNSTDIEISDDQVMRRKIDEDEDGIWDYNIVSDFEIEPNVLNGRVYWDINSNDAYDENSDSNISKASITLKNPEHDMEYTTKSELNGTYLFDDLMPGTYNVSVEVEGHVLPVSLEEELTFETGEEESIDIDIQPSKFRGNISSINGTRFIDEEISLLDDTNGTYLTVSTDSEGNFSFEMLLSGNYTINVDIDGFERYSEKVNIPEGNTTEREIVIWPSTDVKGTTTNGVNNAPIPNATVRFDGKDEHAGLTLFATTNEIGFYDIHLRNGRYKIKVKHDLGEDAPYVYLGEIDVQGGDITHDIILERSIEVSGFVYRDFDGNGSVDPFETRPYSQIIFENSNWKSQVTTNFTGYYRVFLPLGDYSVYSTFESTKGSHLGNLSITQYERMEHNILLIMGLKVEGHVYHDINENGEREELEGLSYATVTFKDENGTEIIAVSDDTGYYSINLPGGRDYSVIAKSHGFVDLSVPPMNLTELSEQSDFSLVPDEVSIFGVTYYSGTPIVNVPISFIAVEAGVGENKSTESDDSDGNYSLGLLPGEYRVFVDFNTTENGKLVRFQYDETINIKLGENTHELDLELIKMITVNGTINGTSENVTIFFQALDIEEGFENDVTTINGTFEIFLVPGEYRVLIDHEMNDSSHYVFLDTYEFLESQEIELNVSKGVEVEGEVEYDGIGVRGIKLNFTNNSFLIIETLSGGGYNIFLPPNRTYEISVNQTKSEDGKDVWYTFNDTVEVLTTPLTNFDIDLTKYVKVNGMVYLDLDGDDEMDPTEGIENISLQFDDGTGIKSLISNESGNYEVYLELDVEYTVILSTDFPIVEEEFTFKPTMAQNKKDFLIIPANLTVSGQTLIEEIPKSYTALWFWGVSNTAINRTATSDAVGNYSVDLSYGTYHLYARKVSDSEVYAYLGEISVMPRGDLILDIELEPAAKVKGKAYYINSSKENLSAQVQIEFEGAGKIITNSDESGQFEFWLPPDNYTTQAELSTFEFNMTMNYTYKQTVEVTDDMKLYLSLSRVKHYDIVMEWINGTAETIEQNGSVTYNVSAKNTGNTEELFYLYLVGPENWNLSAPKNVTLGIGETKIFEVQINASPTAKVEHDKITLTAESKNTPTQKDSVDLKVNIVPVYTAANISFETEEPKVAKNNSLIYKLKLTNMGNARDNFILNLTGLPEEWNATLTPNEVSFLGAGEAQSIILTINISYDANVKEAILILKVTSGSNMTSELNIEVSVSNLEIGGEDLKVSGEQVSEGALNTTPIPGFEAFALLASLFAAAIIMKRRKTT
ncbi:MAG: glycosyltransferase family 39 protein [Methanomassiliicoccales archaeon]|nr:MAG: glycosyltransferase family 39 protein [Methanomassiliicoccales archaeon]